jgi:hypothetical protein
MPKVSATEKKKEVEKKVEEKVKAKTKTIVKRVVIDTSALLSSIAESLGKFDKDSQKEFLIKLRSDIDKLLAKYSYGGMTDGATQIMNIQQSNLSSSSVNPTMFSEGGGVRKYAKGGLFGESAKLEYVDDAFSSDELKSELQEKLGISSNDLGDNVVISFAYTDYGGDFLDKVAIRYFQENYPENTLVENTGYNGENAYVFGEPAKEWIESTEDYPLGFENIEELYYEMQNESEYEGFEYFLDDLQKYDGYVFDKDEVMSWLMENRGGYYSMTTQGLDFSYSDLTDELVSEGLIRKEEEEFGNGGSIKDVIVYDNGGETFDRYTIFTPDGSVYGMSDNASMPNGFNQYLGDDTEVEKGSHLGKRLKSVPKSIEKAVMQRMSDSYAKGGMTEHGLRIGDKIMGESKDLNAVFVKNDDEWHNVFLDKGKRYENGGGVDEVKYEVVNRNDKHYGKVGVSLHGWNLDERGRYYCTLQFPNGSVSTYGEGEVRPYQHKGMRFSKGGGVISVYNLRKGDKIRTRKGDIETIERKIESGYFTKESEYSHPFESIEFIERPNRRMSKGGGVYNRSWHFDRARHNKNEKYEVPMNRRKKAHGGTIEERMRMRRGM